MTKSLQFIGFIGLYKAPQAAVQTTQSTLSLQSTKKTSREASVLNGSCDLFSSKRVSSAI